MDRNEFRKNGWDNDDLAESLKKHEHEHRNLASILLNVEEYGGIGAKVVLFLLSLERYVVRGGDDPCPNWQWMNMDECRGEEDNKRIESLLKSNPLPGEKRKKGKKASTPNDMKKFKNLLDNPKSAWKVINGGKGGIK